MSSHLIFKLLIFLSSNLACIDMALRILHSCRLLSVLVLLPVVIHSQDFVSSRATHYGSSTCPCNLGTAIGACGFGAYGRTVNGASVGAVSRLWKNGIGCGACYQVLCKAAQCNNDGVNIVVTDHGASDDADFILSGTAYGRMARPNMAEELFKNGSVDVEYRRIPCRYLGDEKIIVNIHENSKFPGYLAIVILYRAGLYDVLAAAICPVDCKQWIHMRRAYGAVFDLANPPKGPLTLRLQVNGTEGLAWVKASNSIPGDWKVGASYDSAIKLT